MRDKVSAVFIILIFLAFLVFQMYISKNTPVIGIIRPDLIQVDLNGNRIADDDETICIAGAQTFTLKSYAD